MFQKGDNVVVGVSGGADSMSLLYILRDISFSHDLKIYVAHINHCIRGKDSDNDERYVSEICGKMGIPFFSFSIDIKKEAKKLSVSEETAGRFFRYKCFNEICDKFQNAKIALAHNKNDNAETIVMRFIRGTGIKGLCGIPPVRGNIVRPLIECQRDEIENYCFENKIFFRTDVTNTMDVYTRNKIRLKLLPWISENINGNIISSIVKNAAIISEEEKFLEKLSDKAFDECVVNLEKDFCDEVILNSERLFNFDDVIKRRVIRKACRFFSEDLHDISYKHINCVIDLAGGQAGKILRLPSSVCAEKGYGYVRFFRFSKKEFFSKKESLDFCYDLLCNQIVNVVETGDTVVLSKDKFSVFFEKKPYFSISILEYKIRGHIRVRARAGGDRIFVKGVGNKKLKNIFAEKGIGERKRAFIPIVCDNENVISIAGVKISDLYIKNNDDLTKEAINIYFWRSDAL